MDYQSLYQSYKDAGLNDQEINTLITDQLAKGHLDPSQVFSTPDQSYILGKPTSITQPYGNYNPSVEVMSGGTNTGADFAADEGTPVALPPGDWKVLHAYNTAKNGYIGNSENSGYGNSILVQNDKTGEKLRLSHLSQVGVSEGQKVQGGKVIAATGKTGNVTGPHLDLEYYDANGKLGDVMQSQYAPYLPVSGGQNYSYPSGTVTPQAPQTQVSPQSQNTPAGQIIDSNNGFGNEAVRFGQGGGNPLPDFLKGYTETPDDEAKNNDIFSNYNLAEGAGNFLANGTPIGGAEHALAGVAAHIPQALHGMPLVAGAIGKALPKIDKALGYRYHVTTPGVIDSIAEKGLLPSAGQYGKGVYFAPSEDKTFGYTVEKTDPHVMLRVHRDNLPSDYDEFPEQGWTNNVVNPNLIEMKVDGNWQPLKSK